MTTTPTWWRCLECEAHGHYAQALTGGAAERHTRDSGHGTTTSLRPMEDPE